MFSPPNAAPEEKAPNRPLDLEELHRPFFRRVLDRMDALTAKEGTSYLHPSKRWEYPWALERARLSPGSRVLDAGCGASIFPIYLASEGHRVSAVDFDVPEALDRTHGVQVEYTKGDILALPCPDGEFDSVFCISVIEHLPPEKIPKALSELRRVLRPGGRLLLTTDYAENASSEIWYEGPGSSFRVDWNVFDETLLRKSLLEFPGLRLEGGIDLFVDWERTRPLMRRFHGYPYTSVGIALIRV